MVYIIRALESVVMLYVIMIAIRALMVWLRPEVIYTYKKFFDLLSRLVDPLISFVRRVFPTNMGRVDLSPVIAVILVETVKYVMIYFIRMLMAGKPA